MEIILIRHAAAEPSGARDDSARELTPAGRRQLASDLPALQERLRPGKLPVLFASPALRTMQTAELLKEGLGAGDILPFLPLRSGDFDALAAALEGEEAPETLILVGHEPILGDWSLRLSGVPLAFKKGGMAGFQRLEGESLRARLRWILRVQAPEGAIREDPTGMTLAACQAALRNQLHEAARWRRRLLREPKAQEGPHQLRVSLRKARALLSFLKPCLEKEAYAAAQTALGDAADRLAALREIDVLSSRYLAWRRKEQHGSPSKALARVLGAERSREEEAVCAWLSDASFDRLLLDLAAWTDSWREPEGFADLASRRLAKWRQRIDRDIAGLKWEDQGALHALRLRLKKINALWDCLPPPALALPLDRPGLKALQRDLGEVCDLYTHLATLDRLGEAQGSKAQSREVVLFCRHLADLRETLIKSLA
ncbi:MAG: CHAD domain-containing protein [Christensenellales bacterium]